MAKFLFTPDIEPLSEHTLKNMLERLNREEPSTEAVKLRTRIEQKISKIEREKRKPFNPSAVIIPDRASQAP